MLIRIHKIFDFVAYWWHELTTSRYVRHLERENKRLQAENSALWNTVWGTRGIPGHLAGPTSRAVVSTNAPDGPMAVREAAAAASQPESRGPVVVRSSTRPGRRQAEAELLKEHRARVNDRVTELKNELNDEIKHEREKAAGKGYVQTDRTAEPVAIQEPDLVLLDEPEVQQEA